MPDTAVSMALYSLPSLRSNVCDWAGPPFIHSRMHDLCLAPCAACSAARAASTLNHPDTDAPRTPAAVSFSASRRVRFCLLQPNMVRLPRVFDYPPNRAARPGRRLSVADEFGAVDEHPQHAAVAFL